MRPTTSGVPCRLEISDIVLEYPGEMDGDWLLDANYKRTFGFRQAFAASLGNLIDIFALAHMGHSRE
jgi:hypothetical protein